MRIKLKQNRKKKIKMDDDDPTTLLFIRKIKTKEIERGVSFRTLPSVMDTQTLEEEKRELNDLNARLEMLVELLRTKKLKMKSLKMR